MNEELWIRYAIIGKDSVFSYVPIQLADNGQIILNDAMYDLVESPLYMEAIELGFPALVDSGEYYNPETRLYLQFHEGEPIE